jgi:hypothetical protein
VRLQRNKDLIDRRQGVQGQHAQRRRAIDQHEIVVGLQGAQRGLQALVTPLEVDQLDLRAGELALLLPLVACLLVLSAWPALVSESSFAGDQAARVVAEGFR